MLTLGIADGQTSGAAICRDHHTLVAVNEERLVRKKQARGFPRAAIVEVFRLSGVTPGQIEAVAVAQIDMNLTEEVREWKGWFEERSRAGSIKDLFWTVASRFGFLVPSFPFLKSLYYGLRSGQYKYRRRRIEEILAQELDLEVPVHFYHHHLVHAASAYLGSGFDEATVVTLDGGGDRDSSHVYHGKNGILEKLNSCDSYDSLGNYYAYVTALSGFKAKKHEGKITGLAASGKPVYKELLESMITFRDGKTRNIGKVLFRSALETLAKSLPADWKREDLACSIQVVSEDVTRQYCRHWARKTGSRNMAVAGGIFANVRINQEVHELPEVDSIFVYPGMSDEGLAAGAALTHYSESLKTSGASFEPSPLEHVYLGNSYSDEEIEEALKEAGLDYEKCEDVEEQMARLLAAGHIVARFNGAMEFGPRALGNRSILYTPTDRSVNDWLNKNLQRTEFMPFAPAVLYERAEQCFKDMKGGWHTAEFMTITYRCTDWMEQHCEGVVHIDGTARPHLVRKETNLSFYRIIENFEKLTGLPCVINTSFNMHEEPIVCTPADAIRAFTLGHLDFLGVGNFLVKSPHELVHEPKNVVFVSARV